MQRSAFKLLSEMEETWWYRGRASAVTSAFNRTPHPVPKILDYGAGFGGMRLTLSNIGELVYAYEPDAGAHATCVTRGYADTFSTEEKALSQKYNAIALFDVLEHIEGDEDFIRRIRPALAPGGYLALTIPAFPFLWSIHDIKHQHFRRYRIAGLKRILEDAGYTVRFASYWNMHLFIPAALMRLLGKTGESGLALPIPLNNFLYIIMKIETRLMRYIRLPFGTGIVLLAQYPGMPEKEMEIPSAIVAEL